MSVRIPPQKEELKEMLKSHGALSNLSDDALDNFIKRAIFKTYIQGETIIRQDEPANHFYFILQGHIRSARITKNVRELLGYVKEGQFFGERALLQERNRDVVIEAPVDVNVAQFDKEDWQFLLSLNPGAMKNNMEKYSEDYEQYTGHDFEGRRLDEIAVYKDTRHSLALLSRLPAPVAIFITSILLGVVTIILGGGLVSWLLWTSWIIIGFMFVTSIVLALYSYLEWRNDDFIVTSERVIHIERTIFFSTEREESPLSSVIDVNISDQDFVTRLFKFNDVIIRTAGTGDVHFTGVKDGEHILEIINEQRTKAKNRSIASDTAFMRKQVADELDWKLDELEKLSTESINKPKPSFLARTLGYFVPRVQESDGNTTIRRKHLFILLGKLMTPLLFLILFTYILVAAISEFFPFNITLSYSIVFYTIFSIAFVGSSYWLLKGLGQWSTDKKDLNGSWKHITKWVTASKGLIANIVLAGKNILAPLIVVSIMIYLIVASVWHVFPFGSLVGVNTMAIAGLVIVEIAMLAWAGFYYGDWQEESYIVTPKKVQYIRNAPFSLGGIHKREFLVDAIENTNILIPTVLHRFFKMGDVVIKTAASGDDSTITFKSVYKPREVQQEIYQHMSEYKDAQKRKDMEVQSKNTLRWLGVYHRLTEEDQEYKQRREFHKKLPLPNISGIDFPDNIVDEKIELEAVS
ncbi:MAG: hypothetical protein B6242_12135 [Anaerolineaceae bacterium 4572_78]|nr:MAG: hypothetical protein B6242_12135 [Anaerolineaceae bacterium 4572_78]